ncbi:hypothetical protein ACIBCB_01150 [Streptomyces uncialis]|uniref:hypothetical protein n=1 Tax=Streptomyces uncialis TaxID=1048205 RepID=UPI00225BAF4E|nr:hypothetical protein [Streptomyces uncialis]MCX4658735.1 hypothetical protein [Streptomyces uncialis]WTE14390.1 hypothetical protein OG924_31695 [Streptomyces uncialis]
MKARRRTAAVAALVGALGLSTLNAPAAWAADTGITVSDIVVNKGKPIVVGTSKVVEPSFGFRVTLPRGYTTEDPSDYSAAPFLYRGSITRAAETGDNYIDGSYTCFIIDSRRLRCEGRLYIDPHPAQEYVDSNSDATSWKVGVSLRLWKADGSLKAGELETRSLTVPLKRLSKATVDASPEPVAQRGTLTVTGKLTRANWNTKKYDAYGDRTVSLQFRAKGTDTFRTVKKATTSRTGALKAKVTASADGYYRWVYQGNSATGAATSTADYVDVR